MAADTIFDICSGMGRIKASRSTNLNIEPHEINCTLAEVTLTTSQVYPKPARRPLEEYEVVENILKVLSLNGAGNEELVLDFFYVNQLINPLVRSFLPF